MRIAIVNQFVPPEPPPTARLAGELGDYLLAQGHHITFISDRRGYQKGGGSRLLRELGAHARILCRGIFKKRVDLVIAFSSPPCLPVTAHWIALRHRAPLVHWAMDVYPDIALALGEIRPGLISRISGTLMNRAYRKAKRIVALDEDMANVFKQKSVHAEVLAPWIPKKISQADLDAARDTVPAEPFTWLYSGNLGRAHEWETLLETQALVERQDDSISLVFQGGGPMRKPAEERARQCRLERCIWKDYAAEEDLLPSLAIAQVLVASQKPEAEGLLWPSKLALMLRLARPILWIGRPDSAIARLVRQSPRNAVFAPGEADKAAAWLLAHKGASAPKPPALPPADTAPPPFDPETGLAQWLEWIESIDAH